MSALEPASLSRPHRFEPGAALARALIGQRTAIVLLLFALIQQSLGHHNGDNSWLFTVAERMLQGARPYVDVLETNPPAAFLLYLPAVALARLCRLPVEFTASALVFAAALASILAARRMALRAGVVAPSDAALFLNAGIFALLVLPGFSFAEREHIAAIALLPMLALYAARARGAGVDWKAASVAGLCAGLAVAIKPHFACALVLPFAWLVFRCRSLRPTFAPEHWAASALVLAYGAAILLAFPAFFDVLPSLLDVYVPVMSPFLRLVTQPWLLLNVALLGATLIGGGRRTPPFAQVLMLASTGFLIAYLVQGKGWVNHGLPGVSLAFLAAALTAAPALGDLTTGQTETPAWKALRRPILFVLLPALLGAPILFGTLIQFTLWEEYPGLTAAVRRHAPPHPRLASISGELDVGHPLVRRVDGIWSQRPHSLWLMACARMLLDTTQPDAAKATRLRAYIEQDARTFHEDVAANRPDLILVETHGTIAPALTHPEIVAALAPYRPVETVGAITLWARTP